MLNQQHKQKVLQIGVVLEVFIAFLEDNHFNFLGFMFSIQELQYKDKVFKQF